MRRTGKSPYAFWTCDYSSIMDSPCLSARKFDEGCDAVVIRKRRVA